MESNRYYLIGYQYINGNYTSTNRETGEITQGTSNKYILSFACPHNVSRQNIVAMSGLAVETREVRGTTINSILGLDQKADTINYLNDLIKEETPLLLGLSEVGSGSNKRVDLVSIMVL